MTVTKESLDKALHPQRWTGAVSPSESGGFVAFGDYLKLERVAARLSVELAELRAALAEPLRRGTTGVCSRNICECEREGFGDQCVWLRPVDEPHIDGYPLMSGLPPPAQAEQQENRNENS